MNAVRNWNTSTASGPVDDPIQAAIDAIDENPAELHRCACRVINSGSFDDALWGEIRDEYKAQEFDRFIAAVRTEVQERANESIYTAREFNREALQER